METLYLDKCYTLTDQIGEGGFSYVWRAKDNDGKFYAIKQISTDPETGYGISCLMEASIMASYKHPCLNGAKHMSVLNDCLYIVQSEALCSVDKLARDRKLTQDEITNMASSVAQGLRFLHLYNMVHADVKPSNVLVFKKNDELVFKLSDFNLTTFLHWRSDIAACTTSFRPIEAWEGQWDEKIDIWGWGCLVYLAVHNVTLFSSQRRKKRWPVPERYLGALYDWEKRWYAHHPDLHKHAPHREYNDAEYEGPHNDPSIFSALPGSLDHLMLAALCPFPEGRPTAEEIVDHEAINPYVPKNKDSEVRFKRVTVLKAPINKLPKLSARPDDTIAIENYDCNKVFIPDYTDKEPIAELASRIYLRFLKSKGQEDASNLHYYKTAAVWMASKLIRSSGDDESAPVVEPSVSIARLCRVEREICRELKFVLH